MYALISQDSHTTSRIYQDMGAAVAWLHVHTHYTHRASNVLVHIQVNVARLYRTVDAVNKLVREPAHTADTHTHTRPHHIQTHKSQTATPPASPVSVHTAAAKAL